MSALPPKADIAERECHVRFVPKADIIHTLQQNALINPTCIRSVGALSRTTRTKFNDVDAASKVTVPSAPDANVMLEVVEATT